MPASSLPPANATPVPPAPTADSQAQGDIPSLIQARRARLDDTQRPAEGAPTWGLALSGGGIRSATFCFGLLKALAQNQVFHRFDVLSTVSGGGYIGSTIGKLYHNAAEAGQAPQDV